MKAPIVVLTCSVYIGGGSLNPKPPYSYLQTFKVWSLRLRQLGMSLGTLGIEAVSMLQSPKPLGF